ncbi:MAG: acetyl-CoA acetyltransferase [Actinomycetes bacterium]
MPASVDPNAPLIAGVAQRSWRDGSPGPVEMLATVAREALEDAGGSAPGIASIDALCAIRYVSAEHSDPAGLVAEAAGIRAESRIHTSIGGDTPQAAVGELAGRIAAGEMDSVLICGGEALATVSRHLKQGTDPGWADPRPDWTPSEVLATDREPNRPEETAAGLIAPLMIYPLFEHAVWATTGGTADEQRRRIGDLWSRFSRVAATNPHAWSPGPFDADAIATPSPANRLVTMPYTKLMNSNIQTDQAAAVLLCSHSKADSLGIPADRRVYLHGSAHATEPWFFSEREDLGRSPAIGRAVGSALGQAGTGIDEIALLDIYSCFPSAVQIAGLEIGFDPFGDSREPTVTGGLSFAGGPGNGYVLHSIASMVGRLRDEPDEAGLVTAVGWYLTKHSAGVYGAKPPVRPFERPAKHAEPQAGRAVAPVGWSGTATAETATVIHERDGSASYGILTAMTDDGRRVLRSTSSRSDLDSLPDGPVTGIPARLPADGGFSLG